MADYHEHLSATIKWCGENEPHDSHEWHDGVCPGSTGPSSDADASGGEHRGGNHGDADSPSSASGSHTASAAQPQSLENRIDLMRWSEHIDEARKGSLADVWWNRDVPALIAVVRAAEEVLDYENAPSRKALSKLREAVNALW